MEPKIRDLAANLMGPVPLPGARAAGAQSKPLAQLAQALEHLKMAHSAAAKTADLLCGEAGELRGSNSGSGRIGVFGDLERMAAEIHARAAAIEAACARIQKEL